MKESNDLPNDEIYLRFFTKSNEAYKKISGSIGERLKYLVNLDSLNLDKESIKKTKELFDLRNEIVHPGVTLYDEEGSRYLKHPSKQHLTSAEILNEIKLNKINSIYEFIKKTTQNIKSAWWY